MDISLADPDFSIPGNIDLLLGAPIFSCTLLHGRRFSPSGTPHAFKTWFKWVLAGVIHSHQWQDQTGTCCFFTTSVDDLLKQILEIKDYNLQQPVLSLDERTVVEQFQGAYSRDDTGRYIVLLPMKTDVTPLGESKSLVIRRFTALKRSLRVKSQFKDFAIAMREYFEMGHTEPVPASELKRSCNEVYYLPMHVVRKECSTRSKVHIVFNASAKSSSGTSLNDQLLVRPTVYSPLVDVLLRFRRHKLALTTDVSRMYRAVLLPESQHDLHRFVWREDPERPLLEYQMTRLTFGVSASSFAANVEMKQNALQNVDTHPQAAQAVLTSFYVDNRLTSANSIEEAVRLHKELQELFALGGFVLHKWKTSEPAVTKHIPSHLLDKRSSREIPCTYTFTKVLGVEWDTNSDTFCPMISSPSPEEMLTKQTLLPI